MEMVLKRKFYESFKGVIREFTVSRGQGFTTYYMIVFFVNHINATTIKIEVRPKHRFSRAWTRPAQAYVHSIVKSEI